MSLGGMVQPAAMGQVSDVSCIYCGDGHAFESCPSNPASVCYARNQNANRNNPYSNSYNPGWRQHPNFSWGVQGASSSGAPMHIKTTYPLGFSQKQPRAQPPPPQVSQSGSLESLMKEYMAKNDAVIQSQAASLRNLEIQMGQLVNELRNIPQDTLPSDTENPRRDGKEQCKAITLRNAIAAAIPQQNATEKPMSKPPPPFPQRFQKQQKDGQFRRFLDVLKQLHINILLVDALEQMPNYVKFLKDILTKKRRLGEFETVALTEGCSAILKNKIPPKLKDPGSFTIPISIGGREKLGIGEARPTTLTLQLADRSMVHPEGKIEDVLVQVDKFIFPVDFIILDYEEDRDVPIILGRPFLATGRTLIDVEKGELTIQAKDEQVTFKVFNPIRSPNEVEACLAISVSNFKLIEKMHGKYSNGVKKKVPFEEIEKGGEPWISKEEEPSHSSKLPRKKKKKKKHSRKPQSQMLEVGNRVFFSNSLVKSRCDGVVELYDEHVGRAFKVTRKEAKFGGSEVEQYQTSVSLKDP
ncbi:uncharacterized protein LOC133824234 [Humulus lupulus]|uniref:uncharacterized protein LOC133824234 n=1 Tax=Humulus lupulus TaxID=3486 RepID=UPI002B402F26|nr:uncharacterized protein LOC133824234 [Humulus lupulus]